MILYWDRNISPNKSVSALSLSFPPFRLSRDEKLFKKDLEKALVKSTSSTKEEGPSINTSSCSGSSPTAASVSIGRPTLDDSDYMPTGDTLNHSDEEEEDSDDDDDFEPSPSPKKLKKPSESKKTKKTPSKRENVKVAVKSMTAVKCDRVLVNVKPSPGAIEGKPSSNPVGAVKGTDLPGSRPPGTAVKSATTLTTPVGKKRVAKWVAPAKAGSTESRHKDSVPLTKSAGGTPLIRVGLSRRAPIKPLHSLQSPLRTKN